MTLRLGGSGRTSLAMLASLTLATALACGVAMTGCGGDNTPTPTPTVDAGPDVATGTDSGMGTPDSGADVGSKQDAIAPCATPTFMPGMGTVASGQMVTITSAGLPAGGFIFYTIDGTLPSHTTSPALTSGGTIAITGTASTTVTVHAIASAATCSDSSVATAIYTLAPLDAGLVEAAVPLPPCPTPVFNPNGGAVLAGSNVTITAPNLPTGGYIYYTTDGTNPSLASQVYSSPIQINQSENIRALSAAPTCTNSTIASASFTTSPPDGGLPLPVFTPTATTRINDFLLALSEATPGTLICYTLDGVTTPTCSTTNAAATCTGTSAAYNAATRVNISGAVTDPATGKVTVQAIACGVGYTTTSPASQTYTLQVSAPTMVNPAPSAEALPYKVAGYSPTIATATMGASIQYTTDGTSTPTCGVASPGTNVANGFAGAMINFSTSTTINAVGCKTGYAASPMPDTLTYTIQLNQPVLQSNTAVNYNTFSATVDDTANAGSGDWICATTDNSNPTCGVATMAAPNPCTNGNLVTHLVAAVATNAGGTNLGTIAVNATGTVIKALACGPTGLVNSNIANSGVYTLQLSQPYITPPGTTITGAMAATGVPITSYSIPGNMTSVSPTVTQGTNGITGAVQGYGFICVGTPTALPGCGTNACTNGATYAAYTAGVSIPAPPAPFVAATPTVPSSVTVIGCPAPGVNFAPSIPITVAFTGPGAAAQPTIGPAGGTEKKTIRPTITNNDSVGAVTICYSSSGAPTCSAAGAVVTCGGPGVVSVTTLDVAGAAIVNSPLTLTAGGTGYVAAPVVTLAGGGGTCTTVTATVAAGAVTGVTATGCTGFSTPPTVSFTGGGGTGAAATAVTSNQVAVSTALSTDPTTLQAVACSAAETQSATASQTYGFQLAEPDFTLTTLGDLNGGGTIAASQSIAISTTSNFGSESIHYTTTAGATANCGSGTVYTVPVVVPAGATSFTLSAIACGTAQQSSAARTLTFTVGTATPTITTNQIAGNVPQSPWQNPFQATLTSITAGAQICYSLTGTPGCNGSGGCNVSSTPYGGPFTVSASGTLSAVACTAALGASAVASSAFVLNLSPIVLVPSMTCPESFTVGFDTSATTTALGGPTLNAPICYTTDASAITNCTVTTPAVNTAEYCFNSGGAGTNTATIYAGTPLVHLFASTPQAVNVMACNPANTTFTGSAVQQSQTATVTTYASTVAVNVNGINAGVTEWPAATTFAGSGGAVAETGYFSSDGTNLYFASTYPVADTAAGDNVVFYIGDGTMTGSMTGPGPLGAAALTFPARWAFAWDANAVGTTVVGYSWSGSAWGTTTLPVTVGFLSSGFVEFKLPLTALGSPTTVDGSGSIVTGVGTAPTAVSVWPTGAGAHYVQNVLSACTGPTVQ